MRLINNDYILSFKEMLYDTLSHNVYDEIYSNGERELKISDIQEPNLSIYFEIWLVSKSFVFELRDNDEWITYLPDIDLVYLDGYNEVGNDFLKIFHNDSWNRIQLKNINK